MRYFFAAVLALLVAFAATPPVRAISDPDSITLDKASSYVSVLEDSDVLFVAKFTITYANCNSGDSSGCPTETVTQAFLGNLIDDDGACTGLGTAHLRSVRPVTSTAPGLNGYTQGIFSIYYTAAEWIAVSPGDCPESHALEIEGNPAVFGTLPSAAKQVETPKAKALFGPAVLARASEIETAWAVNLTQSSGTKLTATGEDYFEEAVPNLRLMAPAIFAAGISSPGVLDQEFGKGYKTALEAFGVGFAFTDSMNANINGLATEWGIPATIFWFIIAMGMMGGAAFYTMQATGNTQIGMMAGVIMGSALPLVGVPMLEFVAILTMFAFIALIWMFVLKGA